MYKISIITVCYNGKQDLIKTVDSVKKQDYLNLEYIIIDGNSNDGTADLLIQYQKEFLETHITYLYVSEPDNGIFDAMNKAIELASGDYVFFLNAGDLLVDDHTVFSIFEGKNYDGVSVIYGNHNTMKGDYYKEIIAGEPDGLRETMIFSHQAAFILREDQLRLPYNPEYCICADYNFFLTLYIEKKKFIHVQIPVSYFQEGGLCQQSVNKTTKQIFFVRKVHRIINKKNYLFYVLKRWQYVVRSNIIEYFINDDLKGYKKIQ